MNNDLKLGNECMRRPLLRQHVKKRIGNEAVEVQK
jgi:hypothetical protein